MKVRSRSARASLHAIELWAAGFVWALVFDIVASYVALFWRVYSR